MAKPSLQPVSLSRTGQAAAAVAVQSTTPFEAKIHLQLFQAATAIYIVGPLLGEYSVYYCTGRVSPSLLSSLMMVVLTVANYLVFRASKDLRRALQLTTFLQLPCFCWGILVSGGIHAVHLVNLPIFPVLGGFVFGRKGAVVSTLGVIAFGILLVLLDSAGLTPRQPVEHLGMLLGYHFVGVTAYTGFMVGLFASLRSRSEAALLASNAQLGQEKAEAETNGELFRAIFANAPIAMCHVDTNLRYLAANPAYCRLFGYSEAELKNKTVFDITHPEDRALTKAKLPGVVARHAELSHFKRRYVHKSGTIVVGKASVRSVQADGAHTVSLFSTIEDITEVEALQRKVEVERQKSILNAKLASLGEMAAGVAHEINNPLTIIKGTVRALGKFADQPAELQRRQETIDKSIERIAKIVKGLEKFSRSSAPGQRRPCALADIAREAVALTDGKAKRQAIAVSCVYQAAGLIDCDEIEIEQVLINLINNAMDAAKDQPQPWVHIDLQETAREVVLRVRDAGLGIAPDLQKKLFQPFFSTKDVGQGTGLGLSIARGILDEHQATITLDTSDIHTCFEIRFPKSEAAKHAT